MVHAATECGPFAKAAKTGKAGTVVRGTLYLDSVAIGVPPDGLTGVSEAASMAYHYTIK